MSAARDRLERRLTELEPLLARAIGDPRACLPGDDGPTPMLHPERAARVVTLILVDALSSTIDQLGLDIAGAAVADAVRQGRAEGLDEAEREAFEQGAARGRAGSHAGKVALDLLAHHLRERANDVRDGVA